MLAKPVNRVLKILFTISLNSFLATRLASAVNHSQVTTSD